MTSLKLTKDKIRLLLSMIAASFIAGILSILLSRFIITNYYAAWQLPLHSLQCFVIAYLTIAFYKNKFSLQGEYYVIFKIALLLIIFNFLYQLFFSWLSWQIPVTFFPVWLNVLIVIINFGWYYLLACIICGFDKI
jgi:hypothetical protein